MGEGVWNNTYCNIMTYMANPLSLLCPYIVIGFKPAERIARYKERKYLTKSATKISVGIIL